MINNKFKNNTNLNILYNENIPNGKYLIIDEQGNKLGLFDRTEALKISEEKGIDILVVNTNASPMVARLTDYSKYRYNQQKKIREMKKKQQTIDIKEIRMRPTISENDFNVKVKNIKKFLTQGDKVKIMMRFMRVRGHLIVNYKLGLEILERIILDLKDISYAESEPKMLGNQMTTILTPNKLKK